VVTTNVIKGPCSIDIFWSRPGKLEIYAIPIFSRLLPAPGSVSFLNVTRMELSALLGLALVVLTYIRKDPVLLCKDRHQTNHLANGPFLQQLQGISNVVYDKLGTLRNPTVKQLIRTISAAIFHLSIRNLETMVATETIKPVFTCEVPAVPRASTTAVQRTSLSASV
jgi:hypothetical protein